jgi:hypothetical protein
LLNVVLQHIPNLIPLWNTYPTTLPASTLIILFSEILKFWNFFSYNKNLWMKILNLQKIIIIEMKISELINGSTHMCWCCQGTTIWIVVILIQMTLIIFLGKIGYFLKLAHVEIIILWR